MKNILILIVCTILFTNCKKTKVTHTLKGKVVACINGVETPHLMNKEINLFQQQDGSDFNSKTLANTTVDAAGNFSFTYETTNLYDKLIIREGGLFGPNIIMTGIPIEDKDNLKVYYSARYNLVVSLNAIKPYTNLDTLQVFKPDSSLTLKIPGPFANKRLFRISSYPVTSRMNYLKNEETQKAFLNNIENFKTYIVGNEKLCGDTVYVNIDVK